jgi:hypothetical protein
LVLALAVLTHARIALGEVVRHAILIGNDQGNASEAPLQYARADARKLFGVLRELGGFQPENMVLLEQQTAAEIQRVLISVNARIRAETSAGRAALLFVYYSGHADAGSLHPGAIPLELSLLESLVQGSPAAFRILVLDACRSGALTRAKGGHAIAPFAVTVAAPFVTEGVAFLTSNSADEDAQESDALQGSFFTHYLVSGLRGAADQNRDGAISLDEVYTYTYHHTLQASSQTLHGMQHPTFRLDLKGHGAVPLTWTGQSSKSARLSVPNGLGFLFFAGSESGPVAAEVGQDDIARTLALDPGRYFVRGRAPDYLLEGFIDVVPGGERRLDLSKFERVEYARLARKGGTDRESAHGPWIGLRLRTPLWTNASFCRGLAAGYSLVLRQLSVGAGLGGCASVFENEVLHADSQELSFELTAAHAWDFGRLSLSSGGVTHVSWLRERFATRGRAPGRDSLGMGLGVLLGAAWEQDDGYYVFEDTLGEVLFFNERRSLDETAIVTKPALRFTVGAGKHF